jgi:class 6 POU domain transcription factor
LLVFVGSIHYLIEFLEAQLVIHQNNNENGSVQAADASNSDTGGGGAATTNAGQQQVFVTKSEPKQIVVTGGNGNVASTTNVLTTAASAALKIAQPQAPQQQQTFVLNHQGQLISVPVLQTNVNNKSNGQQTVDLSQISISQSQENKMSNEENKNTTVIKTFLEEDSSEDEGPKISNMATMGTNQTAATSSNVTHATTVDGVNLDEIREFAKAFKLRRLALGLTQTQVGQAMSATKGPAYSQSAICRFEKLDITPKSASKIKPVLEKWMQEAELKYAHRLTGGRPNFSDLLSTENSKKRKRRTSFSPQALEILNEYFEKNTHPSGNQGADITMLAKKLNYDREVIRVWFCNKRQALKNTLTKAKQINETDDFNKSADLDSQEGQNSNSATQQQQLLLVSPNTQQLSSFITPNSSSTPSSMSTTTATIVSLPSQSSSITVASVLSAAAAATESSDFENNSNNNKPSELNLLVNSAISTKKIVRLENIKEKIDNIVVVASKAANASDQLKKIQETSNVNTTTI